MILGGNAIVDPDLLDEVTALVEWPVTLVGDFDESFLEVPARTTDLLNARSPKILPCNGRLMATLLNKFIFVCQH